MRCNVRQSDNNRLFLQSLEAIIGEGVVHGLVIWGIFLTLPTCTL